MAAVRYALEWAQVDARLRAVEPTLAEVRAHAPALADYYNEPTNRALLTNESEFSAKDVVRQFRGMWADGDRPFLLYVDDAMVGDCDLRNVEEDRAEYAILVGPRATQAKGLGTRFTTMVLALAFGPLEMTRVYASVRPENKGSLRMFEKLAFAVDTSAAARRYAEEVDDVCVSLSADDFRRLHAAAIAPIRVMPRAT